MEIQQQPEQVENQDTGIKMNLKKTFFDFLAQINTVEEEISDLRRKITKAFVYEDKEEKTKLEQEKTSKEQEIMKIETELEKHINEFLTEFSNSKTKQIIQCYQDRINKYSKQTIIEASNRLNLQIKDDSKILSIGRKGRTIDELIKQAIQEENQKKQQQNQDGNKSNNTATQQTTRRNDAQPTQNGQQPNSQDNKKAITGSNKKADEKVQQITENPEAAAAGQPATKKSQGTENKKDNQQSEVNKQPSSKNNQNTQNKQDKQNSKVENTKKTQNNNKEEDAYDVYKKSMQNDDGKKDKKEILKEIEEEQKQMTQNEIMESLCLAPDSVAGYEIVSMTNDYILEIKVQVPEQNSYPIKCFKLYLLKKKEYSSELTQEEIKQQACLDGISISFEKEEFSNSHSSTILCDLKTIKPKFIQSINDEISFTHITITAISQSPYEDTLESEIKFIFRLNLPKIILEKTRLLLSGSCELISKDFFKEEETFFSLFNQNDQCLRNFVCADSQLFNQFNIQSVNFGNSAMLLLKDGSVIQWGSIPYFLNEIAECPLEDADELIQQITITQPFMPVQHPLVFTRISQGEQHYVGVTIDGKVYSWGLNTFGQLGHQNEISYAEPKRIDYFFNEKIFIVDVKCTDNFTVCQSIDGALYTFGKHQALMGEDIKDLFNNTINYCNLKHNQVVPRKIIKDDKIISYACGSDHCIYITDKNTCFVWGNNEFMQVCQNEFYQLVHNFVEPIPVLPVNGGDYIFKKVFCSLKFNSAILENKKTGDQIYVHWGGNNNKGLDINKCKIQITQPLQENEMQFSLPQKPQFITKFNNFYTNTYSNLIIINENNQSKLYANGLNTFCALGVQTKQIKNIERVPLPQCNILQISLGDNHTTALLVV